MAKKIEKSEEGDLLTISPPKINLIRQRIVGVSPYVQARFAEKARREMQSQT